MVVIVVAVVAAVVAVLAVVLVCAKREVLAEPRSSSLVV